MEVAFAGFTPAALARFAAWRFILAALFLWITPFLTALSILLTASPWALVDGAFVNCFKAALKLRFVLELRTAARLETRTRFLADLIIGMKLDYNRDNLIIQG